MKLKLIAMLLSTTLLGGTTLFNCFSNKANVSENKKAEVVMNQGDSKGSQTNNLENKVNEAKDNQNKQQVVSNDKQVAQDTETKNNVGKVVNNNNTPAQTDNGQAGQKEQAKDSNKNNAKVESKENNKEQSKPSANENTQTKNDTTSTSEKESTNFMAQVESRIFERVNAERAKAGVPQLSYNNTMQKYARIKSQDMGVRNYFDHQDPEGNLITAKMKADGVSYMAWGENIAYIGGVSDANALADQFMTNWMNSPGHRANILSSNFKSIGVGVYKSGNRVYATQEFFK